MKKFIEEFKKFALKGNVVDMAVGVIIGGAFTAIVTSLTANFLNPLLSFIFTGTPGKLGETETAWTLGAAGAAFLTTVVNFLITALVLFLIIKGMNKLMSLGKKPAPPPAPTTKDCPFCYSPIHLKATRCPHCTAELPKAGK